MYVGFSFAPVSSRRQPRPSFGSREKQPKRRVGPWLASWRRSASGSGSASVVNGIVYFSTLANRTYGLEARTGRAVWIYPDGEYTPVVADSHRLYVVGYRRVYAFTQR